jgi:hypothetical protein
MRKLIKHSPLLKLRSPNKKELALLERADGYTPMGKVTPRSALMPMLIEQIAAMSEAAKNGERKE